MKGKLSAFIALILICAMCLSSGAYADAAKGSDAAAPQADFENAVINAAGEVCYNDGETVFNNFGVVYNNGGVVFNNGGTVYNNSGTVYNNGGIVYNNGATVINNEGIVFNDDGTIEDEAGRVTASSASGVARLDSAKADAAAEKAEAYKITLAGDYDDLATLDGLDANGRLGAGMLCAITPKDGVTITDATTTTGTCSMDADGNISLSRVDRDGTLTLKFKLDAPIITPTGGSFGGGVKLTMTAAEGAKIYYTLDGSAPTEKSSLYSAPVELDSSAVVKAVAIMDGAQKSDTAEESYIYAVIKDVDLGTAQLGYKQPEATPIVVKNTGLGKLVISEVKLAGDDADSFVLSTEKGGKVASGQSDSKTWTICPKKALPAGEYEAEVVFTFDSGDTMEVDVSFTVLKAGAKTQSKA